MGIQGGPARTRVTSIRAGRLLATAGTLLATVTFSWALKPSDRPLPDYDAAGGLKLHLPPGSLPDPATTRALGQLESDAGDKVRVVYNTLSRVPRSLSSKRPLSSPDASEPATAARRFLKSHRDLWRLSADEVDALALDASYTDSHSGV